MYFSLESQKGETKILSLPELIAHLSSSSPGDVVLIEACSSSHLPHPTAVGAAHLKFLSDAIQ